MSSAMERVLNITELLEQILLSLSALSGTLENSSTTLEQLFTLQRVSKMFQATITKSLAIQRKMMLAHDEDGNNEEPAFGMDYAFKQRQSLLPFVQSSYYNDIRNKVNISLQPHKHGIISLTCAKPSPDDTTTTRNNDGSTERFDSKPSWREMKLCSHPQAAFVYLFMTIAPGMSYMSMIAFQQGAETLGELSDRVEQVLERNKDEHMKYMKEYRETCNMFNKPLIHWQNARLHIQSVLDTPEVVKLCKAKELHSSRTECGRSDGTCAFCAVGTRGKFTLRMMKDI